MIEIYKVLSSDRHEQTARKIIQEEAEQHRNPDADSSLAIGVWALIQAAFIALPVAGMVFFGGGGDMLATAIVAVSVEAIGTFYFTRQARVAGVILAEVSNTQPDKK